MAKHRARYFDSQWTNVGVDVGAKEDIHYLLHELANEGLAVIIISDDLLEVVNNCSRCNCDERGNYCWTHGRRSN